MKILSIQANFLNSSKSNSPGLTRTHSKSPRLSHEVDAYAPGKASYTSSSATQSIQFGVGLVSTGLCQHKSAIAISLALGMANGEDIFGYRLNGKKSEVVLVTGSMSAVAVEKCSRNLNAGHDLENHEHLTVINTNTLLEANKPNFSTLEGRKAFDKMLGDTWETLIFNDISIDVDLPVGITPTFQHALRWAETHESADRTVIFICHDPRVLLQDHWEQFSAVEHFFELTEFLNNGALRFIVEWKRDEGHVGPAKTAPFIARCSKKKLGRWEWSEHPLNEHDDTTKTRALAMRNAGITIPEMIQYFGVSKSTVYRWLQSLI